MSITTCTRWSLRRRYLNKKSLFLLSFSHVVIKTKEFGGLLQFPVEFREIDIFEELEKDTNFIYFPPAEKNQTIVFTAKWKKMGKIAIQSLWWQFSGRWVRKIFHLNLLRRTEETWQEPGLFKEEFNWSEKQSLQLIQSFCQQFYAVITFFEFLTQYFTKLSVKTISACLTINLMPKIYPQP